MILKEFTIFLSVIQGCILIHSSYTLAISKCFLYSGIVQIMMLIHWVSYPRSQVWLNLMIWYLCGIHTESFGFFLRIELNYLWCHRVSVEILWLQLMTVHSIAQRPGSNTVVWMYQEVTFRSVLFSVFNSMFKARRESKEWQFWYGEWFVCLFLIKLCFFLFHSSETLLR